MKIERIAVVTYRETRNPKYAHASVVIVQHGRADDKPTVFENLTTEGQDALTVFLTIWCTQIVTTVIPYDPEHCYNTAST